ncbi:hypothetical protein QAD02_001355 [Eretmocerus hayati]|uniref:Uncharacterized protein n=1 Tax=Eretmocerus hayati TaxID=131215 RepID=A0ACC2NGQ8_9HYME|nr:hypothetical protein QAD02_001355 [Eretmocerus hayati]
MLRIRTIVLSVLLSVIIHSCTSDEKSEKSKTVFEKFKKGLELLENSNSYVGTVIDIGTSIYTLFKNEPDNTANLEDISKDLKNLIDSNGKIAATTEEINKKVDKVIELQEMLPLLREISQQIQLLQEDYNKYLRYKKEILDPKHKLSEIEGFHERAIKSQSIPNILVKIKSQLVEDKQGINKEKTLLHMMLKHMQKFDAICGKQKSMNMMINDLYKVALDNEIKGYMMMLYALEVKKSYQGGDTTRDLELIKGGFMDREKEIMTAFKRAMKKSSRAVWTCDPGKDFDVDFYSLDYGLNGKRNTFMNMEPVYADDGKVVTGARFRKSDMNELTGKLAWEIYLEIQQGELLPNGSIDQSTLSWKNGRSKEDARQRQFVYLSSKLWMTAQDFEGKLENNKPIFVTGLAFAELYNDDFHLLVYGSPVDFTSKVPSVLNKKIKADTFISLKKTEKNNYGNGDESVKNYVDRKAPGDPDPIEVAGKKGSETSKNPSNIVSRYNYFIRFEPATNTYTGNWKLLLPYFDPQDVVTSPVTPLTGAALYHKGTEGFGGYVGIELRTVDLSSKINAD